RSEGGALGIGGGPGGMLSPRGAANLLTRATAILAAGFFITSLALTILADDGSRARSIMERPLSNPAAQERALPQPAAPDAGSELPDLPEVPISE
ncbi:MAG TPA: preprotein translocase subunit SecG, partial [Sphingomonadales bacterium]